MPKIVVRKLDPRELEKERPSSVSSSFISWIKEKVGHYGKLKQHNHEPSMLNLNSSVNKGHSGFSGALDFHSRGHWLLCRSVLGCTVIPIGKQSLKSIHVILRLHHVCSAILCISCSLFAQHHKFTINNE